MLLSVPGEGRTASLYYTDNRYDALGELFGMTTALGTGRVDDSGRSHDDGGPGITATWLIHDVEPWRVDRIYLNGKGAPWIATQLSDGTETIWESPVVWHQPEPGKGRALVNLLDKLGVGQAAREADDFDGVAGAAVPPAESSEPVSTQPVSTEQPAPETSGITGPWWALGGLAAGMLLTLLGTRRRRRTAPETEAEPTPDPLAGVSEELAWPAPRG